MNRNDMVMLGVLTLLLGTGTASGQVRLENVSITMGVGGEVYGSDGNFLAIAVPQVDSTDSALGASGDMGAAGTLILMAGNGRSLSTDFNFGMRQFWTDGFQARNYAPREHSGRVQANYSQRLGTGGPGDRPHTGLQARRGSPAAAPLSATGVQCRRHRCELLAGRCHGSGFLRPPDRRDQGLHGRPAGPG